MGSGLSIHWVPIILNHIPTRSLSLNPSILGHLSSKPCMQGLEKRHKTVLLKRSDAPVDSLETFQGFSNAHDDRCSNSFVMHIIWSDHELSTAAAVLVFHKNLLNSQWLLWINHKDLEPYSILNLLSGVQHRKNRFILHKVPGR